MGPARIGTVAGSGVAGVVGAAIGRVFRVAERVELYWRKITLDQCIIASLQEYDGAVLKEFPKARDHICRDIQHRGLGVER